MTKGMVGAKRRTVRRREVDSLEALCRAADGPDGITLQSLFGEDLSDEEAYERAYGDRLRAQERGD